MLTTIAHHFPFKGIPEDLRYIYNDPDGFKQRFANSIRLSDEGIKVFFQELKKRGLAKDSLVIVTADHAYPMGEHGNYHLEAGYHQESFRIPFFMVWDGHLQPKKIDLAYSQMDISPTIIDLLGENIGTHNFQGKSILSNKTQHPIYLIQPYAKQFSILMYPYKYRFNAKMDREHVYHLEEDPLEEKNIAGRVNETTLTEYRTYLKQIFLSQYAMEQNLFW